MLQSNRVVGERASYPAKAIIRNFHRSIAALIGALSLLAAPSAQATFATPGQFDVSPTGAATYSIPITVPPGTAGMAPSLALSYNSQGGNGLLGTGWSLSGLSAVTRCPKTIVQDGANSVISYTNTDKYCLDGQRLIAVAGTYGANGTEYRTEREGFSKIVSYGAVGTTGPAWFKVWTKSGQVIQFGATADSRIEAEGLAAVKIWAVNYIADTKGNFLTVTYTEDNANGQYYPNRIDYTGNTAGGLTPYNSVRFVYATRPDITPLYDGGSLIKNTVRLTNVKTYAKVNGTDTLVKDYRLAYGVSAATQRSRLISLTECDGSATPVCLQPTVLSWLAEGIGWDAPKSQSGLSGVGTAGTWFVDINGDGMADYVTKNNDSTIYWNLSTGTGWAASKAQSGLHGVGVAGVWFVDIDGDGMADYVTKNIDGCIHWNLSTGTGWGPNKSQCGLQGVGLAGMWFVDINGDGMADYVTKNNDGTIYWNLSTGTGWGPNKSQSGLQGVGVAGKWFVDINGDGMADYVTKNYDGTIYWNLSTGTGWGPNKSQSGLHSVGLAGAWFVDINGDGKADYVTKNNDGTIYWNLSTGTGWEAPQSQSGLSGVGVAGKWFVDINGDGMADYVTKNYDGIIYWNLSTGSGWGATKSQSGLHSVGLAGAWFVDINGDGKADYVTKNIDYSIHWDLSAYDSLLLTSVTTGLGAATTITYKPLTDATVYTKEATAVYPYLDIQAPMYVVSSVASSNGIGGNYTSNYSYVGAKSHLTGGGFLGFHSTTSTDAQTGIKSTTTYRQDYPYQGLPLSAVKKTAGNVTLNAVTNTWAFGSNAAWSAQYHVPKLTQSVESSYELTGTLISTVTTCNTYDGYGNPTYIGVWTTTTVAGINCAAPPAKTGYHVKETTNSYTNDIVNWYLGRLTNATVTSTAP